MCGVRHLCFHEPGVSLTDYQTDRTEPSAVPLDRFRDWDMDPLNEISITSTTHAFKSMTRGDLCVRADMQVCGWVGVWAVPTPPY